MTENGFASRIRETLALYDSRRAAATVAGVTVEQLNRYVKGRSMPSFDVMARLAADRGVRLDWLASGEGEMQAEAGTQKTLPVYGFAACGLKGWFEETFLSYRIARPPEISDPEAFAVAACGRSMAPEGIADGALCVVSPNMEASAGSAMYIRSVEADGRIRSAIKKLVKREDVWLHLQGYLDDGAGPAAYVEKRHRSLIRQEAPVVHVFRHLPREVPDDGTIRMLFLTDPAAVEAGGDVAPGGARRVAAFDPGWFADRFSFSPENLLMFSAEGEAMVPTVTPSATVLVDHAGRKTAMMEGLCGLIREGRALVRRLQELPGGQVRLMCDNPAYEPVSVPTAEIVFLGRVVGLFKTL